MKSVKKLSDLQEWRYSYLSLFLSFHYPFCIKILISVFLSGSENKQSVNDGVNQTGVHPFQCVCINNVHLLNNVNVFANNG